MKPTDSELAILTILWNDGPSTVRHVNEKLNKGRRVGYTNTLKMMQLMLEKGILSRNESARSHIYTSSINPETVKKDFLSHMIDTVFDGKTSNLLVHALGNYKPTDEELAEIKSIIDKLDNDGNSTANG
ncbi:MAG: BlaI/MecI/CopY family transcriptional regulator [Bacteroidales bacterium]